MSFQNLFFGNIDEDGNLVGELDPELTNGLRTLAENEDLFGSIFQEDAMDQTNELNEESVNGQEEEGIYVSTDSETNNLVEGERDEINLFNKTSEPEKSQEFDVKEIFPQFEKDKILKFTELFGPKDNKHDSPPMKAPNVNPKTLEILEKLHNSSKNQSFEPPINSEMKQRETRILDKFLPKTESTTKEYKNAPAWNIEELRKIKGVKIPEKYFSVDYEPFDLNIDQKEIDIAKES